MESQVIYLEFVMLINTPNIIDTCSPEAAPLETSASSLPDKIRLILMHIVNNYSSKKD
jgi:hypothetical protein